MTMFHVRVESIRAEDGKLIFEVDVDGQKSAPWTYKEFPQLGDLWGLSIHTTGEERDRIRDAITAYGAEHLATKAAIFALAHTQTITEPTNGLCLRCASALGTVSSGRPLQCPTCNARYA